MFVTPSIFLWLVAACLMGVRCYKFLFEKPKNFPSGPPRLPFLGGYGVLLMVNYWHLHKAATRLCEYYKTNILGLHVGSFEAIVVNDMAIVKEVLNRVEFDGRPNIFLARMREKNFQRRGIFFTEGPDWKAQRWFILRYMRDYGFGRRFDELEAETNSEILTLIEMIRYGPKHPHETEFMAKAGGYVMCPNVFFACFANAFLHVLTGERISRAEAGVLFETGKYAMMFQRTGDDYGTIYSLLPWMRHFFPNQTKYRKIREGSLGVNRFIESVIQKRLESHDEGHVRCFLDLYFNEMKKSTPREGDSFGFQIDQLVLGIVDFFFPAISGATTQIALLLERLLWHPEVVQRMQAEIDDVVGHGRLPSLDDRIHLPFTEATLREGMRIDTLVPSGIAHSAMKDTTLAGYDIPKGTIVLVGLDYIHMQKDIWDDPERFRPERFLDEQGQLSLSKDVSVPFGAGKRLCAGETFARNTMFLIVSALAQNFNLKRRPADGMPDFAKRSTGVIISPTDYWIGFEPR